MSEHTQSGLGQFTTDGDDGDDFDPFHNVDRQTTNLDLGINPAPTLAQAPGIEDTGTNAQAIQDAIEADAGEKGTFGEKTETHTLTRNDDGDSDEGPHPTVVRNDFETAHEIASLTSGPVELRFDPNDYAEAL